MSKPITPGDLVMVVRGHSCAIELLGGIPFTVRSIERQIGGGWTCNRCGERDIAREALYGATGAIRPNVKLLQIGAPISALPLQWLKRIPPLGELEGEKRDEEITA